MAGYRRMHTPLVMQYIYRYYSVSTMTPLSALSGLSSAIVSPYSGAIIFPVRVVSVERGWAQQVSRHVVMVQQLHGAAGAQLKVGQRVQTRS